jgi:hypothetical protein
MGFVVCQFLLEHFTIIVVIPEIITVHSLKELGSVHQKILGTKVQ